MMPMIPFACIVLFYLQIINYCIKISGRHYRLSTLIHIRNGSGHNGFCIYFGAKV